MSQYPQYPYGPEENPPGNQGWSANQHWNAPGPNITRGTGVPMIFESVRYGFAAAFAKPAFWLLLGFAMCFGAIALGVIVGSVAGLGAVISAPDLTDPTTVIQPNIFLNLVLNLISSIVGLVIGIYLSHTALRSLSGQEVSVSAMFQNVNFRPAFLVGLVQVAISLVVMTIPDVFNDSATASDPYSVNGPFLVAQMVIALAAILITPLTVFWTYTALDGNNDVGACIREGFQLGARNYVKVLLFNFLIGLIALVALLPCGLGMIVWIPASLLATAHMFRQLSGGPIVQLN